MFPYEQAMREIARSLIKRHGNLLEVHCVPGHDPFTGIELVFADGQKVVVPPSNYGQINIGMMKYGYSGTGPCCFWAFLDEAGFHIPLEEIETTKAPCILRHPETESRPTNWKYKQQIEISGDWMTLFWKQRPVKVYAEPDAAAAFLAQDSVPYLWPDDKEYRDHVDSKDNPQRYLRLQWIVAYLHHPNHEVIIETLRGIPTEILDTVAITDALGDLLVHLKFEVQNEAARMAWKRSDAGIEGLFTILSSQGFFPSEILSWQGKCAAEILRECCPPERRQLFEQLALDAFGPTVAGVKWELTPGTVSFKEKIMKPGALGTKCIYEVYTGRSKLDALTFLESKEVTQEDYFIVVETPEGNWGKDCKGIYKEKG